MTNYFTEEQQLDDLLTNYPHSPEDQDQSITDYLEYQLTQGYSLVGTLSDTAHWKFIFKVVAK